MATIAQRTKPQNQPKRKAAISPDLAEFLHMLRALETELDTKAEVQR